MFFLRTTVNKSSPPHAETDKCEDDDDDGGHGGPDGHGEHLPVNLTLVAVEVPLALAHARPGRVHAAAALVVAELRGTGLAVAPRQTRLARVLVPVTLCKYFC